jgi:hypothetical protein
MGRFFVARLRFDLGFERSNLEEVVWHSNVSTKTPNASPAGR